jgi:lipocalin-like protein
LKRRLATAIVALFVLGLRENPAGQPTPISSGRELVGTWTLVSTERLGTEPSRVLNPRGLLVFDSSGHALEIVTRSGRTAFVANQATAAEAQATFAEFGGFWGSYRIDERQGRITFRPDGAVNPNVPGADLVRSFEYAGDRLTISSVPTADGGGDRTRWVWDRVPVLENLTPAHRQLVGFWQHVVERRVDAMTGATISETRRAPSVIVYTPAGYVGVHFPPLNRKPFASDSPTPEEARAALAGYVGYYGVYLLYPGLVFHHQLANLGGQTTSFKRFFEITGDEISLKFPPAVNPTVNQGREVRTIVTLKRLSGAAEMLGQKE